MARKPVQIDTTQVTVRVLPKGAGKISTGADVPVQNPETLEWGTATYAKGDTFPLGKTIADELEERGFVEIQA